MEFTSGVFWPQGTYVPWEELIPDWRVELRAFEDAGYDVVSWGEHHFFHDGWWNNPPNPVLFGMWVAEQTERIRIGFAGLAVPDWDPIRLAEDIAVLDVLSGGRVEFGAMRGANLRAAIQFNVDADRRDSARNYRLFDEHLEIATAAWSRDVFQHKGEFYEYPVPGWVDPQPQPADSPYYDADNQYVAMNVVPKPLQKPFPPIWQLGDSDDAFVHAGQRGWGIACYSRSLSNGLAQAFELHRAALTTFRGEEAALGTKTHIMRPAFIAKTSQEADRRTRDAINVMWTKFEHTYKWDRKTLAPGMDASDADLDWFDFLLKHDQIVVGSPAFFRDKLHEYEEKLGLSRFGMSLGVVPDLNHRDLLDCHLLFAEEVMPDFRAGQ